jgi:hypothetical protein
MGVFFLSSSNRFLLSTLDDSFQRLDLSFYRSLFLIYLEAELNSTQFDSTEDEQPFPSQWEHVRLAGIIPRILGYTTDFLTQSGIPCYGDD